MKKFFFGFVCIFSLLHTANSQAISTTPATDSVVSVQPTPVEKESNKTDLSNRYNDHVMIQYGLDKWAGTPDSINPKGFSRFFNAYIMLDKPFKTNPHLSVGLGVGIGSSNIFFNKTYVDINSSSPRLPFTNVDSANHFKKFKLTTVFAEAPVELRYSSNPEHVNKSLKAALGVKIGTLINAHTKGKNLQTKSGGTLDNAVVKESNRKFFNSTRLAVTARFGYGIFGIYGAYQVTSFLKTGAGPDEIRPYSIGIYISGL